MANEDLLAILGVDSYPSQVVHEGKACYALDETTMHDSPINPSVDREVVVQRFLEHCKRKGLDIEMPAERRISLEGFNFEDHTLHDSPPEESNSATSTLQASSLLGQKRRFDDA